MESFRRNGQLMDELAEEIPDNLNELYLMYHTQINLLEEIINNVLSRAFLCF